MSRPTVMTPEILERLYHAFSIGCTDEEAAVYAKIGVTTLYDYARNNPEFSQEKEELKKTPILKARSTVVNGLDDVKNAQWYLERKNKDEFGLKQFSDNLTKNVDVPVDQTKPVEEQLKDVLERIRNAQS